MMLGTGLGIAARAARTVRGAAVAQALAAAGDAGTAAGRPTPRGRRDSPQRYGCSRTVCVCLRTALASIVWGVLGGRGPCGHDARRGGDTRPTPTSGLGPPPDPSGVRRPRGARNPTSPPHLPSTATAGSSAA